MGDFFFSFRLFFFFCFLFFSFSLARVAAAYQVAIRPPIFPNMTLVPMALERAVSDTTFALTSALVKDPKANAPEAMMKVAP
jgi:hypothetical protein